ncbi:unnamed protein product, partial [Owenia fusiformis]
MNMLPFRYLLLMLCMTLIVIYDVESAESEGPANFKNPFTSLKETIDGGITKVIDKINRRVGKASDKIDKKIESAAAKIDKVTDKIEKKVGKVYRSFLDAATYLMKFGYLRTPKKGASITDAESAVKASVANFQRYARIPATGEVDDKTLEAMNWKRCGMPDPIINGRKKRFVTQSKWSKKSLTYKIENYSRDLSRSQIDRDIYNALQEWSKVSDLKFSRTSGKADIAIRFENGDHGDGYPFDGPGSVLAHAFYPSKGDLHFDDAESYTANTKKGTNLFIVAVHELGHSLGLDHTNVLGATMYPFYQGFVEDFSLHQDDINGIQSLYGRNSGSSGSSGSGGSGGSRPTTPPRGRWTVWSSWSSCSKTCDQGVYSRRRSCYGGKCSGSGSETKACRLRSCSNGSGSGSGGSVNCYDYAAYCSAWAKQDQCRRNPTYMLAYCKKSCNACGWNKPSSGIVYPMITKITSINLLQRKGVPRTPLAPCCPHHFLLMGGCRWGSWSSWGSCSRSCGGGTRTRQRRCYGRNCSGSSRETGSCGTSRCPSRGKWHPWASWETCSKSCGGGTKVRRRYCSDQGCTGDSYKTARCNTRSCPRAKWNAWATWSTCSEKCGGGTKSRRRTCNGSNCKGLNYQWKSCNSKSCTASKTSEWRDWGEWNQCTKSCGTGSRLRRRTCAYGTCSGATTQSKKCNTNPCSRNGKWDSWSSWTACSRSCGAGSKRRTRSCVPRGYSCKGISVQDKKCNTQSCTTKSRWAQWGTWSTCSRSC